LNPKRGSNVDASSIVSQIARHVRTVLLALAIYLYPDFRINRSTRFFEKKG
jgi:hypothetical protein